MELGKREALGDVILAPKDDCITIVVATEQVLGIIEGYTREPLRSGHTGDVSNDDRTRG